MNKLKFIFKSLIDILTLAFYKIFFKIKGKKKTDTWLISERGIDARDNGYWFYKYMKDNHPEIEIKYVISKKSADRKKIASCDIVDYRSKEHYYYFLYSKVLISAQIMGFSPNEQLYYRLNKMGLLKLCGKTVFLQHGITKDFMEYMLPTRTKLDLFICGAIPECKYMIEKYGYSDKVARLTGFSRFDQLENLDENIILIMPTWRKWLKYNDTLVGTKFYEQYMKILNDKDILSLLELKNMKIIFYPHIVLQKFIKDFKSTSEKVIMADFKNYDVQDLLKRSKLLITDYSSVTFDFAYMQKNVLYFQFDVEKYRQEQYADGYYSYENDGFGPVYKDFESLKKKILEYLEGKEDFSEYQSRNKSFFKYIDKSNSERIYEEIKKIL